MGKSLLCHTRAERRAGAGALIVLELWELPLGDADGFIIGGGRLSGAREGYGFRMALRAGRDPAFKIQAVQTRGPEADGRNHIKVPVTVVWNILPTVIGRDRRQSAPRGCLSGQLSLVSELQGSDRGCMAGGSWCFPGICPKWTHNLHMCAHTCTHTRTLPCSCTHTCII